MGVNECRKSSRNAGLSLVELIVVISIMVVMTGLISVGVSVMFSKDAEAVAKTIDDTLSETRMLSMSREGVITMILHIDNSDPSNSRIDIKQKIGDTDNTIKEVPFKNKASLKVSYGGTSVPAGDVGDVIFEFDKGNGSVKNPSASGVITITSTTERFSAKTAKVDLIVITGRHYLE